MSNAPSYRGVRRQLLRILAVSAVAWGVTPYALSQVTTPLLNKAPEQIRIGFQKSAINLVVAKQSGWLEKRFPNTKISWLEFPAGPQLLEALAVGSLEIGLAGDSPPVFAQSAGKDLFYVGAEPAKPDSSAILVPANSPLRELADLKGRRIAVQRGSSAHNLLVRALEKASLQWSDITPIYLAPADARAAFERGSVDAWAIWDPFYSAIEVAIKPRTLATGRGLVANASLYLASRDFVTHHPDAIEAIFAELSRADRFVQEHRAEAIKLVSAFSGLDAEVISRVLQRRPPSPVVPLAADAIADQQRVADTFHALGLIPRQVKVSDIVWRAGAPVPSVAIR